MVDESRIAAIEQAIVRQEAEGKAWTNQSIYSAVGGQYAALSQYLKTRRAGTPARPIGLAPTAPLAAARKDWAQALERVAAFEARRPPGRDRAAQAAHHDTRMLLHRQLQGAETRLVNPTSCT